MGGVGIRTRLLMVVFRGGTQLPQCPPSAKERSVDFPTPEGPTNSSKAPNILTAPFIEYN